MFSSSPWLGVKWLWLLSWYVCWAIFKKRPQTQLKNDYSMSGSVPEPDTLLLLWLLCLIYCDVLLVLWASAFVTQLLLLHSFIYSFIHLQEALCSGLWCIHYLCQNHWLGWKFLTRHHTHTVHIHTRFHVTSIHGLHFFFFGRENLEDTHADMEIHVQTVGSPSS